VGSLRSKRNDISSVPTSREVFPVEVRQSIQMVTTPVSILVSIRGPHRFHSMQFVRKPEGVTLKLPTLLQQVQAGAVRQHAQLSMAPKAPMAPPAASMA